MGRVPLRGSVRVNGRALPTVKVEVNDRVRAIRGCDTQNTARDLSMQGGCKPYTPPAYSVRIRRIQLEAESLLQVQGEITLRLVMLALVSITPSPALLVVMVVVVTMVLLILTILVLIILALYW